MPHLPAVVGLLLAATAATAQPAAAPPRPAPRSRTADTPARADLLAAARSALARGDTPLALSLATRAVESAPTDPRCYAVRAAAHDARRDFAASVADYTRLLSLAPDSIAALHHRGEAHFRLGHFRDSVADFDREISLDPSGPSSRGTVYTEPAHGGTAEPSGCTPAELVVSLINDQ
jgi:tetratricopeptide (TPR) repeat protein